MLASCGVNMMFQLMIALLVVASTLAQVEKQPGFGVTHLKRTANKKLTAKATATTCDNVSELWFTDAIVDKFAPVSK